MLATTAFLGVATVFAISAVLFQHDSSADAKLAEANLKAVARGSLMYANDCDDRLPSTSRQLVTVSAYLKGDDEFMPFAKDRIAITYSGPNLANPGTKFSIKSAFIFNPKMYGILTTKLKHKSKTVLWSYGARNHLSFAFKGKTIVAFADGSVRFVDRRAARRLRWSP